MQKDIRRELNKIDDGSAKTVGRKIGRELEQGVGQGATGAANQVKSRLSEQLGTQVGTVVGRGIGKGIKLSMVGIGAIAATAVGGVGIALKKGFDRLESIDRAQFKLKSLGHSADETAQIMDNALSAVKGTAFGLQDAANIAASAVAAGVKPGQDLAKYLSDVADAAAVSGTDLASMGDVMNNVSTLNAAYNDSLQILAQRGLPIYDWLSDSLHTSTADVKQLASEGKVSAQQFQEAIETHIGGAAKTMGQSFDGAVDNMEASVARLGANFISAILGGDPATALDSPTQAITNLTQKFDEIGVWVNAHRGEIRGFFLDVKNVAVEVGGAVKNIGEFLLENKGAAETLAAVFVGWKVLSVVADVSEKLKGMGLIMRTQLPADAAVGASGITKALSLIAIPAIGEMLNNQLQSFLKDNAPDLSRLNNTNTPDALGRNFRQFLNGSGTDTGTGLPTPQANAPANSRDSGGLPTVVNGLPAAQAARPAGTRESGGVPVFIIPGRAGGGTISGPGTGTSDSILARLSDGEFVVNADATRKNMPLLEIINSGKLPGFSGGGGANTGGTLTPNASQLQSLIAQVFPEITNIGGWRPPDGFNEHSSGQALDLMIPNANTPEGKALGDRVNQWLLQNADALGIDYDLWQQTQWNPDGSSSGMENRGGATANHRDHVHVRVKPGAATGASLAQDYADGIEMGAKSKVDELKQDGSGSSGGFGGEQLGQSIFGGFMQSLGLDGSVFSDFTQWPNFKSGVALANFGGSLLQGAMGQDPSGGGGGSIPGLSGISSLLRPLTPNAVGGSDHAGSGALPGPSIVNNGVIGMDPRALTQRADAHQNQAFRRSGLQAVKPA